MDKIQKRVEHLREEIKKHNHQYYVLDNPLISDFEYDQLYDELVSLEEKYPEYSDSGSPTLSVGGEVVEYLEKVVHSQPMLSLDKIRRKEAEEGIKKFLANFTKDEEIVIEPKLDGLTDVDTWDRGTLIDSVTRGDGFVGERILHNTKTIKNLPPQICYSKRFETRAEIIIPHKELERINEKLEKAQKEPYSNTRNLAAGSVRQLDSKFCSERNLQSIIFDLIRIDGMSFEKDSEQLEFLAKLGLPVVNYRIFKAGDYELILDYCLRMEQERKDLPVAIDGLVLKANNLALRAKMGNTSKHPRWAIAFKFLALEASTILRDIVWQIGRTGQLTPVAILDDVEIDGVNINRASLHNIDIIKTKDIRINDKVIVERANDVIPQVVKSIPDARTGEEKVITAPESCPTCSSLLKAVGPNLYCTGTNCQPQQMEKLIYFCSKNVMDIQGLGEKTVEVFVNEGILSTISDIYEIENHLSKLEMIPGFGDKKINKLLSSISKSKNQPLHCLVSGLGISNLGKTSSKALARYYGNIDNLMEATEENLLSIEDIGPITAKSIESFFANETNKMLISKLKELGLNMVEPIEKTETKLTGQTFVITGTLSQSRDIFKDMIEKLGGKVSGSVSGKTDYLLIGEDATGTSKHEKALKHNVPIISEEQFYEILESANN